MVAKTSIPSFSSCPHAFKAADWQSVETFTEVGTAIARNSLTIDATDNTASIHRQNHQRPDARSEMLDDTSFPAEMYGGIVVWLLESLGIIQDIPCSCPFGRT